MSDDAKRPRRALAPDDSAGTFEPVEGNHDNPFTRPDSAAPAHQPSAPRRSIPDYDGSFNDEPSHTDLFTQPRHNFPARGIDEDTIVVQRSEPPQSMIPAPVLPERGEGFFDGPGPRPRRSALSSLTPPEAPAPRRSSTSPSTIDSPANAESPAAKEPPSHEKEPNPPWFKAHLPVLLASGLAVALCAIGAGWLGYVKSHPSSDASASPSASTSPASKAPRASEDELLSVADAKQLAPNATWAITGTTTSADEHTARPACLSTDPSGIQRLDSFQRTLGTTESNQLAALHQVDAFSDETRAKEAFDARATALASCNEVQMLMQESKTVTGLGDQSLQVTVSEQADKELFHSILLTRTGNILSIIDVAQQGAKPDVSKLVAAIKRSATEICQNTTGCDPSSATVTPTSVPSADPKGWLLTADLPRIRTGAGLWAAQKPTALTLRGTGCENMTLASESGPQDRQQRTFLITQDTQAPNQFGMDEMVFTFSDENAASSFATKLQDSLASCTDRVLGTEVKEINVEDGGRAFQIQRETDDGTILFQVSVVRNSTAVAYLLSTVTEEYRWSDTQLSWLTSRASVRLGQG